MKKIALWNNYVVFSKNKAFDPTAYGIGEDLGYPVILLKKKLEEKGYILETLDMDSPENYEKIIFLDYPNPETCCVDVSTIPKEKKILILTECEYIYSPNSRKDLLAYFDKVFAYNDDLVEDCKYKKLCMPNKFKQVETIQFSNKRFSTMICGNKTSKLKGELYSERLKTIRFMEGNHRDDFDLYGIGFDKISPSKYKLIRGFCKISLLRNIYEKINKFRSYRGKIEKKLDVLKNYKFSFCYENFNNINGYISEKIWDCFFSNCVPVYYGAPNVTDYIPDNCFIDYRNFKNLKHLYSFLSSMTESEYNNYLNNISIFLKSKEAYIFSAEYYADTLIKNIIN